MKSINNLTAQRNRIQEWLINSGAWKRHPKMYRSVENAWHTYVTNIEFYTRKNLLTEGFDSVFANTRYPKSVYVKKTKTVDDIRQQYIRILKMRYPKVHIYKNGAWNFSKAYPNIDIDNDGWFCKVRDIYIKMLGL